MKIDGKNLIIKPVKSSYNLKELLKEVTTDNIHDEVSTGKNVGKEIW